MGCYLDSRKQCSQSHFVVVVVTAWDLDIITAGLRHLRQECERLH